MANKDTHLYSPSTKGFYIKGLSTFIPPDSIGITSQEKERALQWEKSGKIIAGVSASGIFLLSEPAPPSLDEIVEAKIIVVQSHLDAAARNLNYDDIKTAITYAGEPAVPKFQAEGQAFRAWRSLVWAKCYAILDEVNGGLRDIPTDEELISELPALVLPE